MPNEVSVHAQEYSFLEDDFFDTDDEEDTDVALKQEWKPPEFAACKHQRL